MPAPAAVLAHLDAVRIVPAILVRLVVAALAFFASERYRDSYFSASHFLRIQALGGWSKG
jgi:ABC-type proline/glycine betaine transport system permease subunit